MAKKRAGGNKSQAIRDTLAAHPDKSPKEIAEMLAGQGYKLNAQYVSTIKSNAKKKTRRVVRGGKAVQGGSDGSIGAAAEFIRQAGGIDQAQDILKTLEQIRSAL